MKTVVLDKPFSFRLTETEPPGEPGQGKRWCACNVGICGTTCTPTRATSLSSTTRASLAELAVEIVALGPSAETHGLAVGDRCAVEAYLNCGTCIACRRGRTNCCERLSVLGVHQDGGMREQVIVPIEAAQGQRRAAGATGPGRDAGHRRAGARRAAIEPGEPALVIGAQSAWGPCSSPAPWAEVIAMDISATAGLLPREPGHQRMVDARGNGGASADLLGGDLPTLVFDATNARSMMDAFNYAAHSGRIVYVGLVKGELTFSDPFFHSHELTLLAARNATGDDFAWVIDSLARRRFL